MAAIQVLWRTGCRLPLVLCSILRTLVGPLWKCGSLVSRIGCLLLPFTHSVLFIPGFFIFFFSVFTLLWFFFPCNITAFLVSCSRSFLGGGSDVFGWLHSIMEHLPGKLLTPGLLVASAPIRVIIGGPIRGSQADRQFIPGELTECCSEGA